MTPEEEAYKEVHDATEAASMTGTVEQHSTEVDQPQPWKPRQQLTVRCKSCGKSQRLILREGSHTVLGAAEIVKFYERRVCGNCGERSLMCVRTIAPRRWFHRLLRIL